MKFIRKWEMGEHTSSAFLVYIREVMSKHNVDYNVRYRRSKRTAEVELEGERDDVLAAQKAINEGWNNAFLIITLSSWEVG